jgi:hypothetical protein
MIYDSILLGAMYRDGHHSTDDPTDAVTTVVEASDDGAVYCLKQGHSHPRGLTPQDYSLPGC